MTNLTIKPGGELTLPRELCERYGMKPATPVRLIETRNGVLLVPLTNEPMHPDLVRELAEWQELAGSSWEAFPYDAGD
ncbi:MAG TPA: AbrB/MazE/SpoVT family DNA-binding domain-containing protein [Gemmataceae bacterium]|nr:AbrB/MazE/SpoVT family DNA-binding domain-containing protein [Gemmataceae bacterium]